MSDFGDWESDDAHDSEPLDPEQTALRLHSLRVYLAEAAGDELAAWDALTPQQNLVARHLAAKLIEFLQTNPHQAAADLHDVIAWMSGQPEWSDLDQRSQQVAIGLVDDIAAWAQRQGALS